MKRFDPQQIPKLLQVTAGLAAFVAMPFALVLRQHFGERYLSPLSIGVAALFHSAIFGVLTALPGARPRTLDLALLGLLWVLATGFYAINRVRLSEREASRDYLYSSFMGFPRFLPEAEWAWNVPPFALLILSGWSLVIWKQPQFFGIYLGVGGGAMLIELIAVRTLRRYQILDTRDGHILEQLHVEEEKGGLYQKPELPHAGTPTTQELIAAFSTR